MPNEQRPTDGAARAEAKLVWIMPKYRANESRVKLAWLCRVQPIFNEVNRDRGRRGQACLGYAMAIKRLYLYKCFLAHDC